MLVVTEVIFFLPVLPECVVTVSSPRTMRQWAVEEKREVCLFVSVPLLLAAKLFRAHGAFPGILRGSRCNGALDKGGVGG